MQHLKSTTARCAALTSEKGEMVMTEEWVFIERTNEEYSVSSFGRIRSNARTLMRANGKKLTLRERILSLSPNRHKYGYLATNTEKYGAIKPHREVAKAFILNDKGYTEVNHKDGDRLNNHADNLEWVTRLENVRHAHENNHIKHNVKISEQEVIEIRKIYKPYSKEFGTYAIAKKYGISPSYAWRVVKGHKRRRKLEVEEMDPNGDEGAEL